VKKPIPLPTGSSSCFDHATATIDVRGASLEGLFALDHIPSQADIRAAAKAELMHSGQFLLPEVKSKKTAITNSSSTI
jgi:hypothetical protein